MDSKNRTFRRLAQLFTPSWLSGLLCVGLPIVCIGVAMVIGRLQGPALQGDLQIAHHATAGIGANHAVFTHWVDQNQYTRNMPLAIFWAAVGLAIYAFVAQLSKAFNQAADLEREAHYVHSHPRQLIGEAFLHLAVRLCAAFLLVGAVVYTLQHLIPNALAMARACALNPSIQNSEFVLAALASLVISLLLQTVVLRLLFLRVRLFSAVD